MSRTLGALSTHVTQGATSLARCVRLDLLDGTSLGISDHDRALSINLGDGALTYSPSTGIQPSALTLSVGFDADSLEIRGPLNATVTPAAVLGGRYDRARVRLFDANWNTPSQFYPLLAGDIAEARVEAGEFVFEVRGFQDRYNQTIGRVLSPYCPGTHATCCVQIADSHATTVTAITDDMTFTVGMAVSADFLFGTATFTTGVLAGTRPVEIFAVSGNTVTLFTPLAGLPTIGDAVTLKEGCDRTRTMCRDRFANVLEFRGFPEVPGNDAYLKYPVPGQGEG